jgi:hypothetical protein
VTVASVEPPTGLTSLATTTMFVGVDAPFNETTFNNYLVDSLSRPVEHIQVKKVSTLARIVTLSHSTRQLRGKVRHKRKRKRRKKAQAYRQPGRHTA